MDSTPGHLSKRAERALLPALPYFKAFLDASADHWSPDYPEGAVALAVAENRLSSDLVAEALQRHAASFPVHVSSLYYSDMCGLPELRAAIAHLLSNTFMKGLAVNPDRLAVLAGCGAAVDLLLHLLADAGEGALVPAPYYPAFDNDLRVRNSVEPLPVHLDYTSQDFAANLDAAAAAAAAAGHPVRVLLLTHPTNPQGTLYSRQQLASCIRWCLKQKVHCVSDEVYANSVFDESAEFVSAAVVAAEEADGMEGGELAGDLIHVLFGFSKDFCASGLRFGCIHTASSAIHQALSNIAYFASTGGPVQAVLARVLRDEAWLSHFLQENRRRLREAYATLTSSLDAAGIPYVPAQAAMFAWVDLRAALAGAGDSSWEGEARLWEFMARQHKVVLTPGSACHAAEPGWFRICYAWPPAGCLPTAVERIAAAVKGFPQQWAEQQQHQED